MTPTAAIALDGGALPLGGGLLALIRPALDRLDPGGVLALRSSAPSVREDLPAWCRVEGHEYRGCERASSGEGGGEGAGGDRHLLVRGRHGHPRATDETQPPRAEPSTGFAPRGARVEPGGPVYPFTLVERDRVAPPEAAYLYQQALAAQWDAATDVPWSTVKPLPEALGRAVSQVMSFLAENELSALYLPSKFVSRLHPAYVEVAMFLSSQLADEARHIQVFLRRARAGGDFAPVSSAITSRSLLSLLELEDFSEASFLLSVLGEGTFLDLLRFIERHAPDEATAELARRARSDEARHVHFGVAHVRHALTHDPSLYARLEAAVRKRAATLAGAGGVPAPIQDALTILAARGDDPPSVARGHQAFRELLQEMSEGRVKRLSTAGFTDEQARTLSDLHTPNFM